MAMASTSSKVTNAGIAEFLATLPNDELFSVLGTTTGGLCNTRDKYEAIEEIIKYSDAVAILNRKRVKKEYLAKYLLSKGVRFDVRKCDKSKLCQLVLGVWKWGEKEEVKGLQFPDASKAIATASVSVSQQTSPAPNKTLTVMGSIDESKPKLQIPDGPRKPISKTPTGVGTMDESKPKLQSPDGPPKPISKTPTGVGTGDESKPKQQSPNGPQKKPNPFFIPGGIAALKKLAEQNKPKSNPFVMPGVGNVLGSRQLDADSKTKLVPNIFGGSGSAGSNQNTGDTKSKPLIICRDPISNRTNDELKQKSQIIFGGRDEKANEKVKNKAAVATSDDNDPSKKLGSNNQIAIRPVLQPKTCTCNALVPVVTTCEIGVNTDPDPSSELMTILDGEVEPMNYEDCVEIRRMEMRIGLQLGLEFAAFFYDKLNWILDFGPQHFWPECNLKVEYNFSAGTHVVDEILYDGPKCCEKLKSLRTIENLHFNPNVTVNGVRGKLNPHGLGQVLVCGTIHNSTGMEDVGAFEQVFGLLRDPLSKNHYKVKFTWLRLREGRCITQGVPAITDSSLGALLEEADENDEKEIEALAVTQSLTMD